MAIKQKPVHICDFCGREMEKPEIWTEDVPHEGCSEIRSGAYSFTVGGQHYCSMECLVDDIKMALNKEAK